MNPKELNEFLKDKSKDFISGLLFGIKLSQIEIKGLLDAEAKKPGIEK